MLNIEIIKFEAQDVITVSGGKVEPPVVVVPVECPESPSGLHTLNFEKQPDNSWAMGCSYCDYVENRPAGGTVVGGK